MPQIISAEPLAQMIRSIALQKRTGMLRVEQLGERSAERGEIYFENGSLMRARTGREAGKAALRRISEWKQITCSFQGMSRPYPASTSAQRAKPSDTQTHVLSQTDRLARVAEGRERETEPRESASKAPIFAGEKMTHPLSSRRADVAVSASAEVSSLPVPVISPDQPLIVHGTRLETYAPVPSAVSSRSVQRWTTHLLPELEELPVPRKLVGPGPLPPLKLPSGGKALPGRMAIFKIRSSVSTARAIGQMERRARVVFILLDGRRTIEHIARLTHQTEAEVEQILLDLMQHGYADYVGG
jgi:hypothetical protein